MNAHQLGFPGQVPANRVLDVTILLVDGSFASTAIGPAEVFYSTGVLWNAIGGRDAEPRFRVRTVSVDGGPVGSPYGIGLTPDGSVADVERTDIVIVPGTALDPDIAVLRHSALIPWLVAMHQRGALVAGICTGVFLLAEAGLLDGREATTHWAATDRMRTLYPKVRWRTERFVTEDGGVCCSGGVYASIDLSLHLVEKYCGREMALQCAKSLLVSMPRTLQSGYSGIPMSAPHGDEQIRCAESWLQLHFDQDVQLGTLAGHVGMSSRNFIRRFKAATGLAPSEYLQRLRVAAAKCLLERGVRSIQAVSAETGYEDVTFFRGIFKRHTGMTPAEYRSRFAPLCVERGEIVAGQNPK